MMTNDVESFLLTQVFQFEAGEIQDLELSQGFPRVDRKGFGAVHGEVKLFQNFLLRAKRKRRRDSIYIGKLMEIATRYL